MKYTPKNTVDQMRNCLCLKAVWMSHYTRVFCLPRQEISCCFDETNIHRNPALQQGANLSCPTTTCKMYTRPFNVLLAHVGHNGGKKKNSQQYRQNEMDSCIKWMRSSSHQDLGYTTVYYTYGLLCPTFPHSFTFLQPFHDNQTLKATSNFLPF